MSQTLDYLRTFAAFPFALRRFLRRGTLTLAEARRTVRYRMARREENFLALVARGVYGHPRSPYLPLLRQAGCELGDLRNLVRQKGLESTLRHLRAAGVYITFEEFKGRKPITRGGQTLVVQARDFDNPAVRGDYIYQTGGSSGAAQAVASDMEHVVARASHKVLALEAHGLLHAPSAIWRGILPDGGPRAMLRGVYTDTMPVRWFTPIGWRDSKHWLKYGLATAYLITCMRLAGMRVPWPEVARTSQPLPVARWLAETARAAGSSLLRTNISRAVRVCLAAAEAGLDLRGATLMGGGEPATPAKVRQIQQSGARYVPSYGMVEAGTLGAGCGQPLDGSDLHFFSDGYVLFTHPHVVEGFGVEVPAFNLTTLLDTAPKVMLNVQIDDYGIVEERACGCALESYGYTTHLRQIRSYSKLTGEGVTLIGSEVERILEEVLPARFGGTPLDYQLVEEEDELGLTRIYLTVHPSVSLPDEAAAARCLLDGLRRSSAMADAARIYWENAGAVRVRRAEPVWTSRGKFLPLHVPRRHS